MSKTFAKMAAHVIILMEVTAVIALLDGKEELARVYNRICIYMCRYFMDYVFLGFKLIDQFPFTNSDNKYWNKAKTLRHF